MYENKGRPSQEVYIDGKLYLAKKPLNLAGSVAVVLPKDWLEAVSMGRDIRYLLLDISSLSQIVVKPYYDVLPAGQERG